MQLFGPSTAGHGSYNYLQSFVKLVAALRHTKSTCSVIEQSCGGLISASILMQPGASQCYIGSSVIYNTAQCQPLLLLSKSSSSPLKSNSNNVVLDTKENQSPLSLPQLFQDQLPISDRNIIPIDDEEVQNYIQSKIQWTTQMAIQYCTTLKTDYAIAEGGAVGPTFRPKHLKHGFSVIAVAGRQRRHLADGEDGDDDTVSILRQEIVIASAPSATRIQNMYSFAQTAANICHDVVIAMDNDSTFTTEPLATAEMSSSHKPQSPQMPETMNPVVTFDRAAHIRSNPTFIQQLLYTSNDTKFVVFYKKHMLIHNHSDTDAAVQVAYLHRSELQQYFMENEIPFLEQNKSYFDRMGAVSFLGTLQQQPQPSVNMENDMTATTTTSVENEAVFAIDLSTIFRTMTKENDKNQIMQQQLLDTITKNGSLTFVDTRSSLPLLSCHNDHEIVLYGTALMEWKRRNIYCSNCGSIDVSYQENGGTVGQCQNCQTKFWPRQDPSIIVLIVSNDRQRVLLANHVRHQHKKIYTTLAGFVEVGESMESAVVREVYEETGIRVDTTKPMQYIGTQPWPFPQSCMIGFIATADDRSQQITIDPAEIYDAQWFSKEDILAATTVLGSTLQTQVTEKAFQENPNLSCVIPPKGVIARKLIDTWMLEGNDRQQLKNDTIATATEPKSSFLHDDAATSTSMSANQEEPVVHRIRIK